MLPKQHRLTSRRDIRTVFARGRTYVHRLLVLKVLATSPAEPTRFGFSTSAALGTAVMRNRARRLLREAVRPLMGRTEARGHNVVLIARPPTREAGLPEISRTVEGLFRKAGLLRPPRRTESPERTA